MPVSKGRQDWSQFVYVGKRKSLILNKKNLTRVFLGLGIYIGNQFLIDNFDLK